MRILTIILFSLIANLSAQIYINELMSSNTNVIYDEFGESSDWIELYNSENIAVNIGGYGLSDDADDLYKWIFPSVTMNPNSHLLIFASDADIESNVQHWETIINWGDTWKYFLGNLEPPQDWKEIEFYDDNWLEGESGFGYGDGDDATIVPSVMSVFVRKAFYIESIEDVSEILLHIDYDDAFVAYINGTEIGRSNIGDPSEGPPPYNQGANAWREAEMYTGGFPERFDVNLESITLQEGENLLAIQVHNYDQVASDMSLIPFLTLGLNYIPENAMGSPEILNLETSLLHTNFKISSSGEQIILTDLSENIIDEVDSLVIPSDISYGRQSDGEDSWFFFQEPTPNQSNNNSSGFESFCSAPYFY